MEEIEKEIEQKVNEKFEPKNENLPSEKPKLEDLQGKYLYKQVESGKDVAEIAIDFAKTKVTSDIINDNSGKHDKLHEELAKEQKDTLKESFKGDKYKQQAKTIEEKQKKAEAFYVSFRPILEFDFSNLIKKEKKDDKIEKTYKDRSYGIPLMCLMLCLFVVPYCIVSLVLAIFNGINAVFEEISTFGKIAKTIVLSISFIAIACLVIYFCLLGIDYIFGTDILSNINL